MHREQGTKSTMPPLGNGRGMVVGQGRQGGEAGMRVMETGRGRMGLLGRRTLGPTGIWAQVEEGEGGKPDGGRQTHILQGTPWAAYSSMVGKRRQAAMDGGRGRRPDGRR